MRNLFIAIVCAAALSSCKGQRVVAGDANAAPVAAAGVDQAGSAVTTTTTQTTETRTTTATKPQMTQTTLPASMGRPVEVK
jgi:hypothetical protein